MATSTDAYPDFKPAFTNGTSLPEFKESKGATLVGITLEPLPLTSAGFGKRQQVSVPIFIIKVNRRGFARVPQSEERGKYTIPEGAQYLTEICSENDSTGTPVNYVKGYSFMTIMGFPKHKGLRKNDVTHELWPGMIIRQTVFADRTICQQSGGREELPAFTVVSFEWNCKGWTKWTEGEINPENGMAMKACPPSCGYGGAVTSIEAIPGVSAYSFVNDFSRFAKRTVGECQAEQRTRLAKNRPIENVMVTQNAVVFVPEANCKGHVGYDPDKNVLNIVDALPGVVMDIKLEDAFRYTNSSTCEECAKIIELHLLTGSLALFAYYNEYRVKPTEENRVSPYCAIPLLNTEKLFKSVCARPLPLDETGRFAIATPGWKLPDDQNNEIDCQIKVTIDPLPDKGGECVIGSPDLCLTSTDPDCIRKGYAVAIVRGGVPCWGGRCVQLESASPFLRKAEDGAHVIRKRWMTGEIAAIDGPAPEPATKKTNSNKK